MRLPAAWRPMVPWAIAAVLCAPLPLSMLVFGLLIESDVALLFGMEQYVERLDHDFAPPSEDAPEEENVRRGVVFATSGLACAITGAKRLPGGRVELMVLPRTSAALLEFNPLIGPTIAARPDFVIVQSTLLVAMPWNVPPSVADAARYFWREKVRAVVPGLFRLDPRGRGDTPAQEAAVPVSWCHPKPLPMARRQDKWQNKWQDTMNRWTSQVLPLVERRRDRMRAILLRFAEAGIPVLVVTPPINEFNAAYFARVSEEARSTVGPATGAAAVAFLEPSRRWPNEQFSDPVHINPGQDESYRAWLSAAILVALGS